MFRIVKFQPNAAIVVEGKMADQFYIVKEGQVQLTPEIPIPGEEVAQLLKTGDFFGVVSSMSGHPYIETAQAISQASTIAVHRDQFAWLIQKNTPIAMKIIRYFSQRLRVIDQAITKLSFHDDVQDEDIHLMFNVGEYYDQNNLDQQAITAYQKYLYYCPQGPHASKSKSRLLSLGASDISEEPSKTSLTTSFKDGVMIFIEHEPGAELYIIQQGNVKITKIVDKNEVLLAVLRPGDIFGEMALLDNKPRSASACAYGDVIVFAVNKANFETMVQMQPQLAVKLITILSERIWAAYRQLANLLIIDPLGRVYDMLLILVQKKQIAIQPKTSYTFDIGVQELSDMIGFPKEEGEKHVIELLKNKDFRLDGGKIICSDLVELEKQVLFYRKKTAIERKRDATISSRY